MEFSRSTTAALRASRLDRLLWALLLCSSAAVALRPGTALAVGEVSGRLGGFVVIDATNDGLAGVKMSVRSPALPGGPQSLTTNDDGSYVFQNLPPGTYELTAVIEGFSPVKQRNIRVLAGEQSPVDIRLVIQSQTAPGETYRIIEKTNPIINSESAAAVTNLNNDEVTKVPNFRGTQYVVNVAPGVSSSGTDKASVRGGMGRFNRFMVDGLDTTDIVGGGISSPMNFDSVEQFTMYVGAMDAEFNSLGLVQNVVTKTGSNKWQVDASAIIEPTAFTTPTQFAPNGALSSGPQPYTYQQQPERDFYSANLNVGGPLIKDKLWFFSSFQFNYNRSSTAVPAVPLYPNLRQPSQRFADTFTYIGRVKMTWQATSSTRLALSFNAERNDIRNNDSSTFQTTETPEADSRIDRGAYWLILLWDTLITPKLLFQAQVGFTNSYATTDTIRPLAGAPGMTDRITASHNINNKSDPFNGFTYLNRSSPWTDESKYNIQFNPSLLYTAHGLGGDHNIKFGAQFSYMRYNDGVGIAGGRQYKDNTFGLPCDATSAPGSGNPATYKSCNQVIEYPQSFPVTDGQGHLVAGPGNQTLAQAYNIGFFAQDRFIFKRWLTIVPGMRVDVGVLQSFQSPQTLVGYGPRLSLIYDVLHDRTTQLTAHYGRHNDVGNAFIANNGNPAQVSNLYKWNTATNSFQFVNAAGGPANQSFAASLTPPSVDEVALGAKREVISDAVVGVDYTYRNYSHMWANLEVNQIWDPTGQRVVGYKNGIAQQVFQASTPADARRDYNGLDLWVKGAPGHWNITASYTLAFANGTVTDFFDGYGNNPRMNKLAYGPLPDNYRHYLKAILDYNFFFGATLGARFQYYTGAAQWRMYASPQDGSYSFYAASRGINAGPSAVQPAGSAPGPVINNPQSWVSYQLPDQVNLDVQVAYNFEKYTHQKFDIYAMFFNVLNLTTATSLQNRDLAAFGTATGHLSPFFMELVLRYRY